MADRKQNNPQVTLPQERNANPPVLTRGERVRLGRALRTGLQMTWDRLGLVVAIGLTCTLLAFLPLGVAQILPANVPLVARCSLILLTGALTLSAPVAGMFHVAHLASVYDEVSYAEFWRGALRMFVPATKLGFLQGLVPLIFAANVWFYGHFGHRVGLIAVALCGYALLFWLMMAVYHFPILAAQENGVFDEPGRPAKRGAWAAIRRAFFLSLGEPLTALGLTLTLLLLTAVMGLTVVLLVTVWLGAVALLSTQVLRALLVRFTILPPPAAPKENI